jgi:outer membrane receptor for ferrienterochelin and colicins
MKGITLRNLVLFFCVFPKLLYGQSTLRGTVVERAEQGKITPVAGASVYWLGTTVGAATDTSGAFSIPFPGSGSRLVVRCVGYVADTLTVQTAQALRIVLKSEVRQVADVEVVGERASTSIDFLNPHGTQVMHEKELFKAACCNLSESFETNPSVDVAFTDAITGTRQIEMLGLAGIYSQITTENLPAVRGLSSNAGLTYIPGTWIENIQVSKGVGSVANGYESITGQINVDMRKPENLQEKRLFLNLFGNQDLRLEGNLNFREQFSEQWSSLTLMHFGMQQRPIDGNGDRFLDMPLTNTANILQRFHFESGDGWEGQLYGQYVNDERDGGTTGAVASDQPGLPPSSQEYKFSMRSQQLRLAGKTGYVFSPQERSSVGLQWSLLQFRQRAGIGARAYDGDQRTGYLNLLYDSQFGTKEHRLRFGMTFLFDQVAESFPGLRYDRTERVPGVFAEYTFTQEDELAIVAGFRIDHHNLFGTFMTPRLHIRYAPDQDWVFRAVAGRGQRTANPVAENMAYLASSRAVVAPSATGEYPFQPEVGWNFGMNLTHYFLWDYREATMTVDFYRTSFDQQLVVDLDRSPQEVHFSNLDGISYSNSLQLQLNLQPIERLETRLAYRYLNVRQSLVGSVQERPFVARHRAFVNIAYSTEREDPDESQMLYDLTVQWFGSKRLPDTRQNPEAYRARSYSPSFVLVNGQVTRSLFANLDLYLGVENLLDFRQDDPILDPEHPNGSYFDSSLIWGPINGRVVYVGIRWRV